MSQGLAVLVMRGFLTRRNHSSLLDIGYKRS
jgi:hypothetical protein